MKVIRSFAILFMLLTTVIGILTLTSCGKNKECRHNLDGYKYKTLEVLESNCKTNSIMAKCKKCKETFILYLKPEIEHEYAERQCILCGMFQPSEGLEYIKGINSVEGDYYIVHGLGTCTDENVVIPDTYDGLEVRTVSHLNSSKVKSLTLGGNIEYISEMQGLTALERIHVVSYNPYLKSVDGNLYSKDGKELQHYSPAKTDTIFNIPDGVETIDYDAFHGAQNLRKIVIGKDVSVLYARSFDGCTGLTDFIAHASNPYYIDIDGCIYSKDGKELIKYPLAKPEETFTIPNGVTVIGCGAFSGAKILINVIIPDTVTILSDSAFSKCTALRSINIPSGITMIDSYVFYSCESLTEITIPNSVTSIGNCAFESCTRLTGITIPDSVICIENSAFSNCNSLRTVIFEENSRLTSIENSVFSNCESLISITIPSSVTSIGDSSFCGCARLTTVYYNGTENEWNVISISDSNTNLINATRCYYSETEPTEGGKFWHYDTNGQPKLW